MSTDKKRNQHFWHFVTAATYALLTIVFVTVLNVLGKMPSNISVFNFFMLTLATFRVTRLLVHDLVLDFVRDYFENATHGLALSVHDLLDCPWCTGAWVALFLSFAYFATPLTWPFLLIMAVAGFSALLTIMANLMMASLHGK